MQDEPVDNHSIKIAFPTRKSYGGRAPRWTAASPISAQNTTARPAIIRAVVSSKGSGEQPAKVVLTRQDEMSQPTPRMLSEERLQRYVQSLQATGTPGQAGPQSVHPNANAAFNTQAPDQNQFSSSLVTWSTPQASHAINLSEATLIRPNSVHRSHLAHPDPEPHLRGWPEETELASAADATPDVDTQLEKASKIDDQLKQLELRISQLRSKEIAKSESEQSIREQEILTNPNTSELVAAISTAIVSALQEKSESEVLPQAKSLFEKRLQQHAVTLGELSDSVASDSTESLGSEAMFSSIAAQRQQEQVAAEISDTLSPTALLEKLRERIADYQRAMTGETATEAAGIINLGESEPVDIEPTAAVEKQPLAAAIEPSPATIAPCKDENQLPLVQFTAPENAAVPLQAASWDVEDFRWPTMTNQMLTGGGEAIKNLLDVALGRTNAKTKRVVVAGAGRGQGTTTIASALARAGNQAGYKTLLIDADVASPQLSQTVGLSAKISWLNGIGTDLPLGEVAIRSKKTNLCLMPLSATVNRVTWPRFIFDNLGEMLAAAESYFDLILIDAGPASQLLDELSNPEQLLDAMVLVDSTAKLKEIEVYQNRLQTFGIDNLVLAENRKPESATDAA